MGAEVCANVDLRVDEYHKPVRELRRVLQIAMPKLFSIVQGMPKLTGIAQTLVEEVTAILVRSKKNRVPLI